MKPPPPRLPAAGQVTASANATAIAASTAFPPCCMMSRPTVDARTLAEATMPCRARTGAREAASATTPGCKSGATGERRKKRTIRSLMKLCLVGMALNLNGDSQPFVTFVNPFVYFVVKESELNHRGHEGIHKGHRGLTRGVASISKNQFHVERSFDRVEAVRLRLDEPELAVERLRLAHRGQGVEQIGRASCRE